MMKQGIYKELAYNASGYYDRTAYAALKKIYKEERNLNTYYAGGIWTADTTSGNEDREVLILAAHESYASILSLCDLECGGKDVVVKSKVPMHTDAGRVGYLFYSRFKNFVKQLPDKDFREILRTVGDELGLGAVYQMAVQTVPENIPPAQGETPPDVTDTERMIRYAKIETERDIYKDLFYRSCPQFRREPEV